MNRAQRDILSALALRTQFPFELEQAGLDASELPALEDAGWVGTIARDCGRAYEITADGRAALAAERKRLETPRWRRAWSWLVGGGR